MHAWLPAAKIGQHAPMLRGGVHLQVAQQPACVVPYAAGALQAVLCQQPLCWRGSEVRLSCAAVGVGPMCMIGWDRAQRNALHCMAWHGMRWDESKHDMA